MSENKLSNHWIDKQHQLSDALTKKEALYQAPIKTFQTGKVNLLTTKEQLCLHKPQLFVDMQQLELKKYLQDLI